MAQSTSARLSSLLLPLAAALLVTGAVATGECGGEDPTCHGPATPPPASEGEGEASSLLQQQKKLQRSLLSDPAFGVVSSLDEQPESCILHGSECYAYQLVEGPLVSVNESSDATTAFIHINKAAGTSVKEQLNEFGKLHILHGGGIHFDELAAYPESRLLAGGRMLGACALRTQPCFYFTVLREPVDRAISDYNYFCKLGMEGRHAWAPGWTSCPLTLVEWMSVHMLGRDGRTVGTNPKYLIGRLSYSNNNTGGFGLEVAKANLLNGCFRYLLLDRFSEGMARLSKDFPWLRRMLADTSDAEAANTHGHSDADDLPPDVRAQVTEIMKEDIDLYNFALENYESQWRRPLRSCIN